MGPSSTHPLHTLLGLPAAYHDQDGRHGLQEACGPGNLTAGCLSESGSFVSRRGLQGFIAAKSELLSVRSSYG